MYEHMFSRLMLRIAPFCVRLAGTKLSFLTFCLLTMHITVIISIFISKLIIYFFFINIYVCKHVSSLCVLSLLA